MQRLLRFAVNRSGLRDRRTGFVNHYRLYHLDHDGRIRHAEWLSAASDQDALELANLIQRSGFAVQELWLWQRRLAVTVLDERAALAA